jgi:hypothetical protein
MSRGTGHKSGRRGRFAAIVGLALLVALAGLTPAVSAKGKKKKVKNAAVTRTATAPLSAGQTEDLTAACGKGTHLSGGGFAIAPNFNPATNSGMRSISATSYPFSSSSWTASTTAFTNPASTGTFTAAARCERNALGQLSSRLSSATTLPPGALQSSVLNCTPGNHVISGGYSGTAASNPANLLGFRMVVLQSSRTGPGQWTVVAYNSNLGPSPVPVTMTAYVLCEKNVKGRAVGEVSTSVPLADNQRASADASCGKKQHVVSGGFVVTPNGVGNVPTVGTDEFLPVGKRSWHVGLHEWQSIAMPAGSALRTIAYCKKG